MQDAGGDRVQENTETLDGQVEKPPKPDIANDNAHLDPSRWWFASSAFPMMAGTLGPVASAFSICALVRPWRQHLPPGIQITSAPFIDDPTWLTVINAVQLAVAVVANLFLLLNMAQRIRFTVAQPITIVGWYISAICLIALNATGAGPLKKYPVDQYVWSQAFYYGIYAAVLYFACASIMVVTFWGAHAGHYTKDFQLTASQRTLMLQTLMFLIYLLLGALVFSKIEGWAYLDTVYWADVTLFTVGFGDFFPSNTLSQALLIPYALIGIISLGLVIGSIRSLVLERGRRRLEARMVEKERRRTVRRMTRRGDTVLDPISEDPKHLPPILSASATNRSEYERREQEFNIMRHIQNRTTRRRRWVALSISTSTWLVVWLVGAKIFQCAEQPYQDWSYFQSFYFCFVSLTTIGYGYPVPISNAGKSFFVFWSLIALPTMTVLISDAGETIVKFIREGTNFLGNLTILPGERGFKSDFKQVLSFLSCGKYSGDVIPEDIPPGFLGGARERSSLESDEDEDETGLGAGDEELKKHTATNPENLWEGQDQGNAANGEATTVNHSPSPGMNGQKPKPDKGTNGQNSLSVTFERPSSSASNPKSSVSRHPRSSKRNDSPIGPKLSKRNRTVSIPRDATVLLVQLPQTRAEYHLLLIEEIARVTEHLKSHPPRRYSFAEWAYYLRLIGEDEHSAETHRRPRVHVHDKHDKHAHKVNGEPVPSSRTPQLGAKPKHSHGHKHGRRHPHDETEFGGSSPVEAGVSSSENGESSHGENLTEQQNGNDNTISSGNVPLPTVQEPPHEDPDAPKTNPANLQWSWVGSRSPLMGTQEEAEWILQKLTRRLTTELRDVRNDSMVDTKAPIHSVWG